MVADWRLMEGRGCRALRQEGAWREREPRESHWYGWFMCMHRDVAHAPLPLIHVLRTRGERSAANGELLAQHSRLTGALLYRPPGVWRSNGQARCASGFGQALPPALRAVNSAMRGGASSVATWVAEGGTRDVRPRQRFAASDRYGPP